MSEAQREEKYRERINLSFKRRWISLIIGDRRTSLAYNEEKWGQTTKRRGMQRTVSKGPEQKECNVERGSTWSLSSTSTLNPLIARALFVWDLTQCADSVPLRAVTRDVALRIAKSMAMNSRWAPLLTRSMGGRVPPRQ
jgi:hypothetical protein